MLPSSSRPDRISLSQSVHCVEATDVGAPPADYQRCPRPDCGTSIALLSSPLGHHWGRDRIWTARCAPSASVRWGDHALLLTGDVARAQSLTLSACEYFCPAAKTRSSKSNSSMTGSLTWLSAGAPTTTSLPRARVAERLARATGCSVSRRHEPHKPDGLTAAPKTLRRAVEQAYYSITSSRQRTLPQPGSRARLVKTTSTRHENRRADPYCARTSEPGLE
jgi:hypothetical protein